MPRIRSLFDQLGKLLLDHLLSFTGEPQTEVEIPPTNPQRIDVVYVPDAERVRAGPRLPGLFGVMVEEPAVIELFSGGLDEDTFRACFHKRDAWQRWRHQRKTIDGACILWIISAGRPDDVIARFAFDQNSEGPRGFYQTVGAGWAVRLIVVSELPRTRDTLLLRLLGRRRERLFAMEDLAALPASSWEPGLAWPVLTRLQLSLEVGESHKETREEEEMASKTQAWFDEYEAKRVKELIDRASAEAAEKGIEKGIEKGVAPLVHLFERRLARPLSQAERKALTKRVDTLGPAQVGDVVLDLSPDALASWLATPAEH